MLRRRAASCVDLKAKETSDSNSPATGMGRKDAIPSPINLTPAATYDQGEEITKHAVTRVSSDCYNYNNNVVLLGIRPHLDLACATVHNKYTTFSLIPRPMWRTWE